MDKTAQARTPDTELFRDAFNASPIGIVVETMQGQPLFVNQAFCSFLGFNEEELRCKHCVDFSPPEDAEKDWALFQQLRAGLIDNYQLEKRYFRRDGSLVWGRLSLSLLNSRESPLVIAMVEDITEKKAAEEARFRHVAIVESSEDAIISKNVNATIVSWNAGAERMFGYTEAEAIGQPITIIIPPELRDEEDKILARLRTGERIEHYETIRVTKTGRKVDVSLIISPVKDSVGNLVGFSKIAHDITERKRAEQALRQREELLKIFVRNVPAGVAMLDRDMRYLAVSHRWCTDYSVLDSSEMLGRSHYELFPDVPDRWKQVHRQALEGETMRCDEDRWDRKDGTTTWVRWEVRPWDGADGLPGGILIFAEDITHRKQMEEALSQVSRKLIESQEQERSRIARELHDDTNQQLALLAIDIEQLRQRTPDSAAEISGGLTEIRDRVNAIAADVQSLSHKLHSPQLEILGIVAAMRGFCREFAAHQKVTVDFTHDNIPRGESQEVSLCLFRVLQEALHNAVKHSNARHYTVRLDSAAGELHLTVSDHGTGFDTRTAMGSGGLGLTSMRERVRLVGGTIAIESRLMSGTTIDVRVPIGSQQGSKREAV